MTTRPTARSIPLVRPHRVAVLATAAALAAAIAGCSLSRPAPVKQTFLLDPAPPPVVARAQPTSLRIAQFNVGAPFRGKTFMVRETELQFAADYYNEFVVAPGAMVGEATARALDKAGAFARVVPPGAGGDADWVLDCFVFALYRDARDPAKPTAELALTFYLTRADALPAVPIWSREYVRRVPMASGEPQAYVAALNAALAAILGDLARDLAAANLAK
jgi:ABC-type uncharacterized transport system auxiliary subunit